MAPTSSRASAPVGGNRGATPLQRELSSVFYALTTARESLAETEYAAFIAITQQRITREAARLVLDEAIRATTGGTPL